MGRGFCGSGTSKAVAVVANRGRYVANPQGRLAWVGFCRLLESWVISRGHRESRSFQALQARGFRTWEQEPPIF